MYITSVIFYVYNIRLRLLISYILFLFHRWVPQFLYCKLEITDFAFYTTVLYLFLYNCVVSISIQLCCIYFYTTVLYLFLYNCVVSISIQLCCIYFYTTVLYLFLYNCVVSISIQLCCIYFYTTVLYLSSSTQ